MKKIPVGVLGATGAVGQRFVQLLDGHPWFEVVAVTGSDRTVGSRYAEKVNWILPEAIPVGVADLTVQETKPGMDVPVVFSALPAHHAREMEPQFAADGYAVVTNASAHRMTEDVPLLIPEINPEHTALIPYQKQQRGWGGFIVASPNCSTTSIVLPMKVWHDAFGLDAAIIVTLQAISGAGYPGVPSLSIMDNIIPHIGGEDEKLEIEPRKILGTYREGTIEFAELQLSAQANRVPVMDGHVGSVSVKLSRPVTVEQSIATLETWQRPEICTELPSSPGRVLIYNHNPDRPQPRLDRDAEKGMAWTVGKVRPCHVLDLRYLALTHNTLRGAASGSILNAELLVRQGYI